MHEVASPLAALEAARARTLALVEPLSDDDVERVHSTLMSPLAWDLGHIAAFETPRAGRGDLPFLDRRDAEGYLAAVRERTVEVAAEPGVGDGVVFELVLRHELQHQETMLQAMGLARLAPGGLAPRASDRAANGDGGLELVEIPAGAWEIGAGPEGFAYDNERPRHRVDVPAFRIGRTPITNATFLRFVEGGGYQRREWWSDEGWAWKEEYDITRPLHWADDGREWRIGGWEPLHPDRPVAHVSWFEADAFARAHGARLPSEAEWEKAATWDQETLQLIGELWEWTASPFGGYPGFRAFPYREYSEVFFGSDYRVLRGGSWASASRVATPTFRNWDYPQRRQIFAGLRIARDADRSQSQE
jgi:gamma-glutamyl hercynylcysteine S-oxide synthase